MALGEVFLIILGLIWITFAVVQDLRKREIANWLNFSLAIFALGFRLFYSLFEGEGFSFFLQGVIGFLVFFVIGNLLYYGKVFAGGDAKLMISLGAVIPFSETISFNLNLVLVFFLLFLVAGALYGLVFGGILALRSKKKFSKEFLRQFHKGKWIVYLSIIFSIFLIGVSFFETISLYLAILIFIFPYIYFSAKAIDESCMIRKIDVNSLTEGDWLYNDISIGKKMIKAKWSGLTNGEIDFLKKHKQFILIRQGIPFSPVFLISYLVLIFISFNELSYFF